MTLPEGQRRLLGAAEAGRRVDLQVDDYRFLGLLAKAGEIGFGMAYEKGYWTSSNLVKWMDFMLSATLAQPAAMPWYSRFVKILYLARHIRHKNTPNQAKENITRHYDLSNAMYQTFLDETLTYSCALFERCDDDLKEAHEDAGAAHAGDMELGAGLFYGYVVVDVPLLVSNLCGCDAKKWASQPAETLADARNVLTQLVNAIATVSPGAKLGSTAPYARAACVLLESGKTQPRTLANGYLKALNLKADPMQQAVDALGDHLAAIDGMYGCQEKRFVASSQDTSHLANIPAAPLAASVSAALDSVFGAS